MDRSYIVGCLAASLAGALLLGACAPDETAGADATHVPETTADRALRSLPYATWVPAATDSEDAPGSEDLVTGVTTWDRRSSAPGLNVFNPRNLARAFLVDARGSVVHSWDDPTGSGAGWHHVELLPGGDLLAILKDHHLLRLAWDGSLVWKQEGRFHHDVTAAAGRLYALSRRDQSATLNGLEVPVLDDVVVILDEQGAPLGEISMAALFGDRVPPERLTALQEWDRARPPEEREKPLAEDGRADLFHLNSVEVIGRAISGVAAAGDLLLSLRNLDLVAVVDPDAQAVRWTWGPGELEAQHHPTVTDADTFLVFDNGTRRGHSRVVEIDPRSGEIVWQYTADPLPSFFSFSRGAAQRLPNGNTLISESDRGRILEVTPEGAIVWEYFCPEIRESGDPPRRERAAIYRMIRITDPRGFQLPVES